MGYELDTLKNFFQSKMFVWAKKLHRIRCMRAGRAEFVRSTVRAVTAIAVVERAAIIEQRDNPSIHVDRHQSAVNFVPAG